MRMSLWGRLIAITFRNISYDVCMDMLWVRWRREAVLGWYGLTWFWRRVFLEEGGLEGVLVEGLFCTWL